MNKILPYSGPLYLAPVVGSAPCPGEAHANAMIDHCPICAPSWGVVDVRAFDIEGAVKAGAVRASSIPDADWDAVVARATDSKTRILKIGRVKVTADVFFFNDHAGARR